MLEFARGALDAAFVGHVEQEEVDLEFFGGELLHGFFAALGGAGAEDDFMPGAGELPADFESDAFVAAGYENGPWG